MRDHLRQGLSVVSARNLTIEDTIVSGTRGAGPKAGIDFEPNRSGEILQNCVIRNSSFLDNAGAGVLVYLRQLSETSAPVSITVEDCIIRGNRRALFVAPAGGKPKGTVVFKGGDIGHPRVVLRTKQFDVQFLD